MTPMLIRARVLVDLGRPEEALELVQKARDEFGDREDYEVLTGLYLAQGRAYGELGQAEPAIEAFQREIELNPEELAPYTHLALIYALLGDGPGAGKTLQKMVEENPSPGSYAEAVRTLRLMGDKRSASIVLRDAQQRWPDSDELKALGG